MRAPIYLDYNATTPLDPRVLEKMSPWMTDRYWNAASSHPGGRLAAEVVDEARHIVAEFVGARAGEIVWTSGATEADNLALKGTLAVADPSRQRLVTVATEHKAILDTAAWLESQGHPVTVLAVDADGCLDLNRLEHALAGGDVALVSVMLANNETGVVAEIATISELAHAYGALMHTDATQAVGKIAFQVSAAGIDLASLSAHKFYGPKGAGALFVSRSVDLAATTHGGGHERGLRSGTLNVPAIVGMGEAATLCVETSENEAVRQLELRDRLVAMLTSRIANVTATTKAANRLPNTASLRFLAADAEAVMVNAPEVAISSGSACTAMVPAPSHVLVAMGYDADAASECLRFSIGRGTTAADIDVAVAAIERSVTRVREFAG